MRRLLLPLLLCLAALAGPAFGAQVDYLRDVKPLLKHHCYACHGALKQEAGLRLDTAASARKGGASGPALLACKPAAESRIVRRITSADPSVRMPQESKPLSEKEIAVLTRWVEQGGAGPADEQPETDPKKHWAFQPVVRPSVPSVKRGDWVRNPIDAFLAAQHEKHDLTPLPPADKATLLRRVTLDLTRLPPTREQLRAHLADTAPGAYEEVVDGLLASPAIYGRRLLAARRLAERGVRFTLAYLSDFTEWDSHMELKTLHAKSCNRIDKPVAGLLKDLKRRGMWDDTVVVFCTEFGRTPAMEDRAGFNSTGRDHHPHGFTVWMAGAGIKGGTIHGATDELGFHAVEHPHYVTDIHATLMHLLGIDSRRLDIPGRKRLDADHGTPIWPIMA